MEPKSNPPVQNIIQSLSETLIAEQVAFRNSINQINSILKHAVELSNESIVLAHNGLDGNNSIELVNVISKATKFIQAEDIISQITDHLNARSLEIDKILLEIIKLSEKDRSLHDILLQINALKLCKVNPIKQQNLDDGESELF